MFISITSGCQYIRFIIGFCPNIFFQIFVIFLVIVSAFYCFTNFFHQLYLSLALNFDSFVSHFHSIQQILFAHFFHFAFHHHDVIKSSSNHDFHVSFSQLSKCRIHNKLSINTGNTTFGNWPVERNIRNSQRSRSS